MYVRADRSAALRWRARRCVEALQTALRALRTWHRHEQHVPSRSRSGNTECTRSCLGRAAGGRVRLTGTALVRAETRESCGAPQAQPRQHSTGRLPMMWSAVAGDHRGDARVRQRLGGIMGSAGAPTADANGRCPSDASCAARSSSACGRTAYSMPLASVIMRPLYHFRHRSDCFCRARGALLVMASMAWRSQTGARPLAAAPDRSTCCCAAQDGLASHGQECVRLWQPSRRALLNRLTLSCGWPLCHRPRDRRGTRGGGVVLSTASRRAVVNVHAPFRCEVWPRQD